MWLYNYLMPINIAQPEANRIGIFLRNLRLQFASNEIILIKGERHVL
jgi:hypothetical protein